MLACCGKLRRARLTLLLPTAFNALPDSLPSIPLLFVLEPAATQRATAAQACLLLPTLAEAKQLIELRVLLLRFALQELAATQKAKKLKGFEAIKGVHLFGEHFT